jgi:hypothetical protein
MSTWVIGGIALLVVYLGTVGWYLKKSFPNGKLTVGAFGHAKTFRWGTYKAQELK